MYTNLSMKENILSSLVDIVGEDYASNRPEELYIYSRDSGAQKPRQADYVVMPKTVEEVQKIIILANKEKIPITPMGGGLTLSALTVPIKGGIVLDMKRMDGIIELNEKSRYAIIEAGVTQSALRAYLEKNYPHLQHSTPESPPTVTIVGNILIQGHGHLTPRYGVNSQMVNGMEVVLPTGEVCQLGSCSVSPYWFSRDPLPDLIGLFLGWFGTTGVVTKLSIQLFPKPKFRDLLIFSSDNLDLVPELIFEIAQLDLVENLFVITQEKPTWAQHIFYIVIISGQSEEELELKKELHKKLFQKYEDEVKLVEEGPAFTPLRTRFLGVPPFAATAADFRKGGGFGYTGAILPVEKVPQAWQRGLEIAHKYGMFYTLTFQLLTTGHSVMFGFIYSFNRADEEDIERARKALDESNRLTLDLGGIVWKAELPAQKLMLEKMDANTHELIKRVKKTLDPNGIMNPGNWEVI
jgi:glycolate oxidase